MPPWLQAELSNGFSADSRDFYPVVYIEYWSLEATAHSGDVIDGVRGDVEKAVGVLRVVGSRDVLGRSSLMGRGSWLKVYNATQEGYK